MAPQSQAPANGARPAQQQNPAVQPPPEKKKRGFWGRLFGKKDKDQSDQDSQPPDSQ
jgi:hypothetical protein